MARMWKPEDMHVTFRRDPNARPVDLSSYVVNWAMTVDMTPVWDKMRELSRTPEPESPADCPHAPGTPEHTAWITEHVIDRQVRPSTQAHQDAKDRADARLARLRNAWGTEEPKTFAYGKSVDELLEFVGDDTAGPLVQDYVMPTIDLRWVIQPIRPLDAYSFLRSIS